MSDFRLSFIVQLLKMIMEMLNVIKDSDGDGRPDFLDSDPNNPEVK